MAAPVYQAVATASTAGAASLTVNKPTGVVDGDLMVAHVTIRTVETITAPAGWTQIYTATNGGGTFVRTATFWRIASGEGASYQFTWPTSQKAVGAIARITGSHASSPIDVAGTPATNTLTADSISTAATECLLLYLSAMADNSTFTAPTGMTERWDQATTNFNDVAHTMASESLSVSGATGTRTGTYGSGSDGSSTLVAIAPPAAGGTTISPTGIASAAAFGTAQINLQVAPTGIASSAAFGTAAINPGPVTITVSGIASVAAFGTATVSDGTNTIITATGITSVASFGNPRVGAGTVTPTRRALQGELNRLANGGIYPDTAEAAQGAANRWAGTTGKALQGALNAKAGTTGKAPQGVLNERAGTSGLAEQAAAAENTP